MNLTIMMVVILLLIGLFSGALSGMIGVGGGIIIVPALVFFLAFSQKEAQGTSLGILLLPVGILGVIQYYKQGQIDLRVVLIVSLAFLAGNYFGSKLALSLPDKTLKKIFAVILIIMAIKIFFFDSNKKEPAHTPVSNNIENSKT
ncbi:MAG TPA: sulfite exporter TauE/SafE family protein [Chitinophagaceae bacterium]|nr:sulfite exporter TauE/SafE family protein [Chitinophagaceae bacterium]